MKYQVSSFTKLCSNSSIAKAFFALLITLIAKDAQALTVIDGIGQLYLSLTKTTSDGISSMLANLLAPNTSLVGWLKSATIGIGLIVLVFSVFRFVFDGIDSIFDPWGLLFFLASIVFVWTLITLNTTIPETSVSTTWAGRLAYMIYTLSGETSKLFGDAWGLTGSQDNAGAFFFTFIGKIYFIDNTGYGWLGTFGFFVGGLLVLFQFGLLMAMVFVVTLIFPAIVGIVATTSLLLLPFTLFAYGRGLMISAIGACVGLILTSAMEWITVALIVHMMLGWTGLDTIASNIDPAVFSGDQIEVPIETWLDFLPPFIIASVGLTMMTIVPFIAMSIGGSSAMGLNTMIPKVKLFK
ncbi:hypothetical protein OAS86_02250 [Gammaproteobacteria bacterium]|nr:hypothetical protein [Gammaproteobacteria bacterium]